MSPKFYAWCILFFCLFSEGCVPQKGLTTIEKSGLLDGIGHGISSPFSFIRNMAGGDVPIQAEYNSGFTYYLGFVIGLIIGIVLLVIVIQVLVALVPVVIGALAVAWPAILIAVVVIFIGKGCGWW